MIQPSTRKTMESKLIESFHEKDVYVDIFHNPARVKGRIVKIPSIKFRRIHQS